MEIKTVLPEGDKGELERAVTTVHSRLIVSKVASLPLPAAEKRKLLKRLARALRSEPNRP